MSAHVEPAVRVEIRPDRVAVLTFDQPGSRANVFTRQFWIEFEGALTPLAPRADLKGLVLASAKPWIFVAGADLKVLAAIPAPNNPGVKDLIEHGLRTLDKLESVPYPTLAAIDGAALGGGLEVALACDFRMVGTDPAVELGLPEVKFGLIPGWGGTQRLPRLVGLDRAAEWLWHGRTYSGPEAYALNLALMPEPSDRLVDRAAEYLAGLPAKSHLVRRRDRRGPIRAADVADYRPTVPTVPAAVRSALLCMIRGAPLPLADGLKIETEAFLRLAGSDESRKLIAEFLAGREKG